MGYSYYNPLKMKCSSGSRRKEYRMITLESSFEHNNEMWG